MWLYLKRLDGRWRVKPLIRGNREDGSESQFENEVAKEKRELLGRWED